MKFLISLLLFICMVSAADSPQQIHLALTGMPNEMLVNWVTMKDTSTSIVEYGITQSFGMKVSGEQNHYWLPLYDSPALHAATMIGLLPSTRYYYRCGDMNSGWSDVFSFVTEDLSPPSSENSVRVAIMADNGATANSKMVLDAISKADQSLHFNFLIISGDLSYANGLWQYLWDDWGNMIQPLASHFPFMVAPGNHEILSLFVAYNSRFNMPSNGDDNLYYSFNYRGIHVLILNSESLNEFHWSSMYRFAEQDLKSVDRFKTPWVFAAFHHPWYCSNTNHNDSAWFMKEEYENLFYKMKVDLVLQGHIHAYERTYPMYNWETKQGAPVYMTDGHAGNDEGLYYGWQDPQPSWSAYRESVFGFSTVEIFNATHLFWQMIRANDSMVRDEFWLIKE